MLKQIKINKEIDNIDGSVKSIIYSLRDDYKCRKIETG